MISTNKIADTILNNLCERSFPIFLTHYQGRGMEEADVFGINRNGYMHEFEIKRTRGDFKAEFRNKRYKHFRLENRVHSKRYNIWKKGKKTDEMEEVILIPNRFYFVCPEGLIKPDELPVYAGLIYVNEEGIFPKEVKKAPLLHRKKANIHVYERVANILSQRIIYGCSYYTYKQKNGK